MNNAKESPKQTFIYGLSKGSRESTARIVIEKGSGEGRERKTSICKRIPTKKEGETAQAEEKGDAREKKPLREALIRRR